MFNKVMLLGTKDVSNFVRIANESDSRIELVNKKKGFRVDAKSSLGVLLAASEWADDIWVDSDEDLYSKFEYFIVIADDDNNSIHS